MADLIPLLTHLEPPVSSGRLRLDRFSPLFNEAEASGITQVRPALAYQHVFPLDQGKLARLAYYFDFDYQDGRNPRAYIGRVQDEIAKWRQARFPGKDSLSHALNGTVDQDGTVHAFFQEVLRRPRLDATLHQDGRVQVCDSRDCAVAGEHWLTGLSARMLVACDLGQSRQALERRFAEHGAKAVGEELALLLKAKLLAEIDNVFLSLPVMRNRTALTAEVDCNATHANQPTMNSESVLRVL